MIGSFSLLMTLALLPLLPTESLDARILLGSDEAMYVALNPWSWPFIRQLSWGGNAE